MDHTKLKSYKKDFEAPLVMSVKAQCNCVESSCWFSGLTAGENNIFTILGGLKVFLLRGLKPTRNTPSRNPQKLVKLAKVNVKSQIRSHKINLRGTNFWRLQKKSNHLLFVAFIITAQYQPRNTYIWYYLLLCLNSHNSQIV